ncbi:unnamed protein product, partial [Bubo scandiacus]
EMRRLGFPAYNSSAWGQQQTWGCIWQLVSNIIDCNKNVHPAFGLIETHAVGLSPSLQPVQVSLQTLPTLEQINTPTQLGVICKLTEGALDPLI